MKAERKHELETNDLSESMNDLGKWIQDNLTTLALGVAVVVVGFVAYSLIFAQKPIDAPAGEWNAYMRALSDNNPEKNLQVMIEDANDQRTAPVVQAKLSLGEIQLASGVRQLFEDRAQAAELLEKARKNLEDVDAAAQDALTRNRARLSLATIAESQNKPEDAQRYYEQVIKSSGNDSMMSKIAAAEYKRVSSANSKDFAAWFAEQKPVPKKNPHMNSPLDPGFNIPETKDFSIPNLPNSKGLDPLLPGLPGKDPEEKTVPADPLKIEPAEKTPAAETPKTETPSSEANKSAEKTEAVTPDAKPATTPETKSVETTPDLKIEPDIK